MSKMMNWMMDMEEAADEALISGAKSKDDVLAYVRTNMMIVDSNYIAKYCDSVMGPVDELDF